MGAGGDGGAHVGGETALVFLMVTLTLGALVAHALSRVAPWLPYTPTLLLVGMFTAVVDEAHEFNHVHTFAYITHNNKSRT